MYDCFSGYPTPVFYNASSNTPHFYTGDFNDADLFLSHINDVLDPPMTTLGAANWDADFAQSKASPLPDVHSSAVYALGPVQWVWHQTTISRSTPPVGV